MRLVVLLFVILYEVVVIIGVSWFINRRNKGKAVSADEFSHAGGGLGALTLGATIALTSLGGGHILGLPAQVPFTGMGTFWFTVSSALMLVLVACYNGPWYRRYNVVNTGTMFERMFDRRVAIIVAALNVGTMWGVCTLEMQGLANILSALTGWSVVGCRIIGGLIMTHGDNRGLVVPPRIAPIQVIVLPIAAHKPGVTEAAESVVERLKAAGIRARGDFSDNSAGWKFAQYEMKGVPLRIEIGPKDLEKGQFVAARRDSGEKVFLPLDRLETAVADLLDQVHRGLYEKAKRNLDSHTWAASSLEEAKEKGQDGFVKAMWCGELACEERMKADAGLSSRCIPYDQEHLGDTCAVCGKPAKNMVIWGVAY